MPEDQPFEAALPSQLGNPRDSTPRATIKSLPAPSCGGMSYGERGDMYGDNDADDNDVNPSNTPNQGPGTP